jgi:hypothetical protein
VEKCIRCGASLTRDEIGLHKKLVNRGSTSFCCIQCLSEEFKIPVDELRRLIERYRAAGCMLFQ